jgi:hypothetical protein
MGEIRLNITDEEAASELGLKKAPQTVVTLEIRKGMNGDLFIYDHVDMDIVVMPTENKIIAFPKENMHDYVYDAQNRLFHYLGRRGVIDRDSVQGGNVHGAIEAVLAESTAEEVDPVQMSLFSISRFMDRERPHFEFVKEYDDMLTDELTEPGPEDSTALGKIPQEPRKGTILPNARPYNLMYKMYEQYTVMPSKDASFRTLTEQQLRELINKISNIPENLTDIAQDIATLGLNDKWKEAQDLAIKHMYDPWILDEVYSAILTDPTNPQKSDTALKKLLHHGTNEARTLLDAQPDAIKTLAKGVLSLIPDSLLKLILEQVAESTLGSLSE